MDRKSLGARGEQKAAEYLLSRGYRILERNFRCRLGEIDIVAHKSGAFVFVEVKSLAKRANLFASQDDNALRPEDHMTPWKQNKVARLAEYYLAEKNFTDVPFQIDLIAIEYTDDAAHSVRHIENI